MIGFSLNDEKVNLFFIKHDFWQKVLRYKFNPLLLTSKGIWGNIDYYNKVLSQISIGPTYKTTATNRQLVSDDLILKLANKTKKFWVADVGVSDGSASLSLIKKIRKLPVKIDLFDKYGWLEYYKKGLLEFYKNCDDEVVYLKIGCFLLMPYQFRLKDRRNRGRKISFLNPEIKKESFEIGFFDVFKTTISKKYDLVKCANVLNTVYFSKADIKKGLLNLWNCVKNDGYLLIVHNINDKEEIMLISKKEGEILKNSYSDKVMIDNVKEVLCKKS